MTYIVLIRVILCVNRTLYFYEEKVGRLLSSSGASMIFKIFALSCIEMISLDISYNYIMANLVEECRHFWLERQCLTFFLNVVFKR